MKEETLSKIKEINPTPIEYLEAKLVVEKYESSITEEKILFLEKKFYIYRGFDLYCVGTFQGFNKNGMLIFKVKENLVIYAEIDDVHEHQQKFMKKILKDERNEKN